MTEPRMYTAEEAKSLREKLRMGQAGPWYSQEEAAMMVHALTTYPRVAEADSALIAAAPDLATTVEHQAKEIEKQQFTIDLLALMIKWMQMDIVRAVGLDHMVQEDGDGDWDAIWDIVWERLRGHSRQAAQIDELHDDLARVMRERNQYRAQVARLQAAIRAMDIPPNTTAEQIRRGTIREEDMHE